MCLWSQDGTTVALVTVVVGVRRHLVAYAWVVTSCASPDPSLAERRLSDLSIAAELAKVHASWIDMVMEDLHTLCSKKRGAPGQKDIY